MQRRSGSTLFTLLAALAVGGVVRAQDADIRYWPLREINFPVPVEKIQTMTPKPAKLRFWVAPDRGRFKQVAERSINDLDLIDSEKGRRGFRYASTADGEYDFALQFVYADGEATPRDSELSAQYRVIFDTRPPLVKVAVTGSSGLDWLIDDENLKPDGVIVEVRWQGQTNWTPISPRTFRARDTYIWKDLNPNQPLEVRVIGRDRAGQETVSRTVTLPTSTTGTGLGSEGTPTRTTDGLRTGTSGLSNIDEFPNRPQIDYVNTRQLTVESKLTRVTRSGVKTAFLWVNDGKGGWKQETMQPVNITALDPNPSIKIPYTAAKDGLYGFIVIPVNGAGGKQDDPRAGDPAQFLIEVDTEKPFVKVEGVKVSPGGAVGPRVEITWQATDRNLMPDPIVLEYSEDKIDWKPIAIKVANTGRYVWEVEDKNLWKFFVRAQAVDKASNTGEHVYDKEVMIDLETPRAVIEKVQGSGGGRGGSIPNDPIKNDPPKPIVPSSPNTPPVVPSIPGSPPAVPKLPDFEKTDPGKF